MELVSVGFYDVDGVFFYLAETARPEQEYSYALAGAPARYVARYSWSRGCTEFTIRDPKILGMFIRYIRTGAAHRND